MLDRLKYRLTHLNQGSWHRRLVNFAFFGKYYPEKACPYWWFAVPASLPLAGLKVLMFAVIVIMLFAAHTVVLLTVSLVAWIFGFKRQNLIHGIAYLELMEEPGETEGYRPMTFPVKPYMVLGVAATALGVTYLVQASFIDTVGHVLLWLVGIVGGLVLLGLLYTKIVHPMLRRLCPPITWKSTPAE